MNTKMKMRMLSLLLCFVMLVGLVPTTVLAAEKNKISEFEATATLPDKLYVGMNLYDPNLLETISFNITKGAPAKLDANSPWMYYNEQAGYYERIYKNDDEQIVKAGVRYAYAAQLRIDGIDYETNTLANHVDVKINGVLWNTTEDPYESSTVTYTWTQSPDFEVSNEPYRQKIPRISATVYGYQNTYFYGDPIVLPSSYEVTVGIPAKFDDTTDVWQKKNGDTWEDCTENTFKGGTYRLKVKLVVDGEDNDTHYLNDGIWGAINGTTMSSRYWHSLGNPTHTANSSYVWMVSPEHVIEGPAAYTVTFDTNGGTMPGTNPVVVDSGEKVTKPAIDPTYAGHVFAGWYSDAGLTTPFDFANTVITGDTTIYAKWDVVITAANATVTVPVAGEHPDFNPISGDSSRYIVEFVTWYLHESPYPDLDANSVFEHGKYYSLRVRFTPNAGYQFNSNTVFTVNGKATASFGGIGAREYSATAYAATYTVTYDANGGTGSMAQEFLTHDNDGFAKNYTFPQCGFTAPAGQEFDKWLWYYESNPGSTNEITPGQSPWIYGNIVVKALWKTAEYNVTVTGGTASIGAGTPITKATMGTTVTLTAGAAPSGQIFDKWVVNGVTVADTNSATTTFVMPAGNVTATATYKDIPVVTYTVTFDANGGTGTMADVTGISGEYTLPENGFTAPDGKQFKAWSVGGVEKAAGATITVNANTTVTAVWENVSEYTKKGDISAVEATAVLPPVLGATTSTSVTITNPTDAAAKGVIISGTSWYKKDASSIYGWTQCINGVDTFEEGTYRLSVQLRSKSNDDKEYYAMSDATTFTVNGVQWNSEEQFRDYYASDGYGYRFFVSPEFTLGGKMLDSIAVTTPPTKTAYREGEDFNPAGMVVTATYTDSSTAPVILYTVTDGTDMAAGKTSVTISYTEGGVTKNTTQTITVAKEYTVTVEGGTGNGKYIVGEAVSISAFVSTGMQFKEWQGTDGLIFTSGDKNSQTATFTMPAHDVTVTAVTGPAEYFVSVSGGSGTGMYETGEIVTIVADPPEAGKQFKTWSVGDGKVLRFTESDITSSTAKFIMPGEAVRIGATYEDIPVTTYTVSFAANGGTGTMADVTGISGEYTLPENGFTAPDGKQFKDWCVGGVEKAVGDKITVTADTTVTAVWETIPAGHTCDIKPVTKVEPSCTEGGKEAYYKCEGCGKFYEDALGAKEITDLSAWGNIAKNGHTESDWKSDKDNHWKECTVAACGVIIENSKAAHADANNDGKCDTCEYNVGTTKPEDNNKPSDDVQSPQTGDNSMMWLWVALLFVSGFGVVATTVIGKKKSSVK